jgi:hypothetical protein
MSLPTPPPPPYAPFGQPEFMRPVQPVGSLAKILGWMLLILLPLQALAVADSWDLVGSARDLLAGRITQDEFETASGGGFGNLAGFLVVPIAVLTIIWMRRMATNLRAIGRTDLTWGPGWAIGGWFVPPFVLYVVPWLMFRELWRASTPEPDPSWRTQPVPRIIDVWWVLYGLVPILGIVSSAGTLFSLAGADDYTEVAKTIDRFAVLNVSLAAIGVVTTGVYYVVVRTLSQRHMRCIHEA